MEKIAVSNSGIQLVPQMGTRRFRNLNKEHLQMEGEENDRLLESKMSKNSEGFWVCKDCSWKHQYTHKAKSHVRSCCLRQVKSKKKKAEKKFVCSHSGCGLSFGSKSSLSSHYRYVVSNEFVRNFCMVKLEQTLFGR